MFGRGRTLLRTPKGCLLYSSTTPMPILHASISMINESEKLVKAQVGMQIIAALRVLKAVVAFIVHINLSFWRTMVRGLVRIPHCLTKQR